MNNSGSFEVKGALITMTKESWSVGCRMEPRTRFAPLACGKPKNAHEVPPCQSERKNRGKTPKGTKQAQCYTCYTLDLLLDEHS